MPGKVTEGKVSEEQRGFRKGKGCVDQIFAIKITVKACLGKSKKRYESFMGFKNTYDGVNREALWSVLKIYCVGGVLLNGIIRHSTREQEHV